MKVMIFVEFEMKVLTVVRPDDVMEEVQSYLERNSERFAIVKGKVSTMPLNTRPSFD